MLVLFEEQHKKSFFIRLTRVIRVPSFSQKRYVYTVGQTCGIAHLYTRNSTARHSPAIIVDVSDPKGTLKPTPGFLLCCFFKYTYSFPGWETATRICQILANISLTAKPNYN
ncbi:MAG: hypothetical protein JWQ09_120 [Segetibacter sp.]|nr:hypothetical protein [Segetibacter sp.]